ncbi:YihY/virulence factor BrkB family protein [Aureivirga marina]|uniref:YihY/virulence factor BrkB family protein n=1 Tax=Aureivirga marina TaxID=1182451 RepID=UPI0018C990F1|nr:YihY/virulence factor BrkB family protein [Aureivirga marina]
MIKLFKDVFKHFFKNNTFQKGAALAYYSVFSLIPMIMIISSVLGIFFGKEAVSGEIHDQLKSTLGDQASLQIQNFIRNQKTSHNSIWTAIIGFITLAFSASGLFSQLHKAFNSIWSLQSKPKNSILNYFILHFGSIVILIGLFSIIILSTFISSFLTSNISSLNFNYRGLFIYEHITSLFVLIIIFSIMFKYLGDAIIHWKPVIYGGIFTAFLFMIGKIGIGVYVGHSHISSTFGTASVLALIMIWVYYTSQIIFLGAAFVEVLSKRMGYQIEPNKNAVKIEQVEVLE